MAKKESPEFNDDNDALVLLPESQGTDDTLILLPEEKGKKDALVLLPEEGQEDDTLVLLPEEESAALTYKEAKLPDEKRAKRDIVQKTRKTGWKKRRDSSLIPKLGVETLTGLPATIGLIRSFMKAVNWKEAQTEVREGLSNTVVIVGQPNTGKSTLFNQLKGQQISEVSPRAGTTKALIRTDFGPFTLVDTPGHLLDVTETGIQQASLVVFMVDGEVGLRPDDRNLLMTIKEMEKPTIVVVNKIDTLQSIGEGDELANNVAMRLGITGVIPISARVGTNVAEELIPAMIAASPEAALVIGRELPAYRREAGQRIIRNATLVSLAAGLEPIPFIDIPILLGTQVRLVLRLAALYGEPLESAETMKHARELIATMLSGLSLRFLAEQVAKAVPFGGDVVAGAIAGAATWSIGEVALEYYEGGKHLDTGHIRTMVSAFYQRFRRDQRRGKLRQYVTEERDRPLEIGPETPRDIKE